MGNFCRVKASAVVHDHHPQMPVVGPQPHVDLAGRSGVLAHVGQRFLENAQQLHPGGRGQGLRAANGIQIIGQLQADALAGLLLKVGHSAAHHAAQALGGQADREQVVDERTRVPLHLQGNFCQTVQAFLRCFALSRS